MPFTGSHPAAVLPLLRFGMPPSALVIGSVVPDLPFYVPIPVSIETTHSLTGAMSADLLIGAAAFVVWHVVLAPAAVALAPRGLASRLAEPVGLVRIGRHLGSARAVALTALGMAVGVMTHIGWDTFTHAQLWGPRHLAWLRRTYGPLAGYDWAQHASSLIGAVAVGLWCWRWWRTRAPAPPAEVAGTEPRDPVLIGRVGLTVCTALGAAVGLVAAIRDPAGGLEDTLFLMITRSGTAAVAALAVFAAVIGVMRRPRGRPGSRPKRVVGKGNPSRLR
jgi:hypothetical protein